MSLGIFCAEVARYLIGFLLLSAGISKFKSFAEFRLSVRDFLRGRQKLSHLLALAVIALELIVAVLCLFPSQLQFVAMQCALLMFASFTLFILDQYFKKADAQCYCFGQSARPISVYDLLRNLLIVVVIAYYLWMAGKPELSFVAHLLIAGIAMLLCMLLRQFHEIMVSLLYRS